jgi:hypothetical protein
MSIQSDNIDFVALAQARLRDLKLYGGPIDGRGGAATQAALQRALAPMLGNGRGTGGGAASQDLDNTDCVMLAQIHLQAIGMYSGPVDGHGDADLQVILQRALSGAFARTGTAALPPVVPSSNHFVIALQGQSGVVFAADADTQYNQVGRLRPAITGSLGRYIYATDDLPGGLTPGVNLFDIEVTNATFAHGALPGGRSINRGARAVLEFMKFLQPTKIPVLIVAAKSGTSMAEMMNDSDPDRYWASYNSLMTYARTNYGEPMVVNHWYGSEGPGDTATNYPNKRGLLWMGQRIGGGAHVQGTIDPDSGDSNIVDHYIFDVTAGTGNIGRGTLRYNSTQIAFAMHPNDQTGVLYRQGVDSLFNDPRLAGMYVGRHNVPSSGHIDPSTDYGQPIQALMIVGPAAVRFAGQSWTPPTITAANAESNGLYVDVTVALPNGGTLTTTRALYGEAKVPTPGLPDDAFTSIRGFEVARPGTTIDNRIEPTRVGAGASTSQMAFAITDPGSGTVPNRTGTVRITPQVPFPSGTLLTYRQGGAAAYATFANIQVNLPFFNHLIEHVPSLAQAGTEWIFPGFEVASRDAPITLAVGAPLAPLSSEATITTATTPGATIGGTPPNVGELVVLIAGANGATPPTVTAAMTAAGWSSITRPGSSGAHVSITILHKVWASGDVMPTFNGAVVSNYIDAHRFGVGWAIGTVSAVFGVAAEVLVAPAISPLSSPGTSHRHFLHYSARSGSNATATALSGAGFTRISSVTSQRATYHKPDPVVTIGATTMPAMGGTNGGVVLTMELFRP